MRIVKTSYYKPANLLVAALQKYCHTLMSQPAEYGIAHLNDIEEKIWQYARSQQAVYPRCPLDKLEVYSNANILYQRYSLWYGLKRPMIEILARPDNIEICFREYDASRQP